MEPRHSVGEKQFLTQIKKAIASKALGRKTQSLDDGYQLREEILLYDTDFDAETKE